VYSLGVVLYHLLVGTSPYDHTEFSKASYFEICKLIREREIVSPSSRLSQAGPEFQERAHRRGVDLRALRRRVHGDLDWITLKCLEKDRSQRYETANGLALDLERFLTNEPVAARRSSFSYSLGKFALRYKGQVFAATLAVAILCVGLFSSLVLYSLARSRYAAAELNIQRAAVLMDANTLSNLWNEYDTLRATDYASRQAGMEKWLKRADELVARLELHQATLSQFHAEPAIRDDHRPRVSDIAIARGQPFDFGDAADEGTVRYLVEGIQSLAAPGGQIEQVKQWRERSPSPSDIQEKWEAMLTDLTQAGFPATDFVVPYLFPLGKNPLSNLWECVDLRLGLRPPANATDGQEVSAEYGPVFVLLKGGTFEMGSPPEEEGRKSSETLHSVSVAPFFISKYEVTLEQWRQFMGITLIGRTGAMWPAAANYIQATDYCNRMSYRLPSEAQWEYACRAGTTGPFSGTGKLDDMGWYVENSDKRPHRIGLKQPNQFGLYDMHGNMLEWCFDRFEDNFYSTAAATEFDPVNSPADFSIEQEHRKAEDCVLRGGPYDGPAKYCRSADRFHNLQDVASANFGLRPVIRLPAPRP
jgi:formylglycine-generating enzyme required for sulfatase activity